MSAIHNVLAGCGDGYINATIEISSSVSNFVLHKSLVSNYIAGRTRVTVLINSGIMVNSNSVANPAFLVSSDWDAKDDLTLINNGLIIGKGGKGADGQVYAQHVPNAGGYGFYYNNATNTVTYAGNYIAKPVVGNNEPEPTIYNVYWPAENGGVGGPALRNLAKLTVFNYGTIGGGGGGGGQGGDTTGLDYNDRIPPSGGGGGYGSPGAVRYYLDGRPYSSAATSGDQLYGGSKGNGVWPFGNNIGRDGGMVGSPGQSGVVYYQYNSSSQLYITGTHGGSAGNAVEGNSNITWKEPGARYGGIT